MTWGQGQGACLSRCFGGCRNGACQFAWAEGAYLASLLLSAALIALNLAQPGRSRRGRLCTAHAKEQRGMALQAEQ